MKRKSRSNIVSNFKSNPGIMTVYLFTILSFVFRILLDVRLGINVNFIQLVVLLGLFLCLPGDIIITFTNKK